MLPRLSAVAQAAAALSANASDTAALARLASELDALGKGAAEAARAAWEALAVAAREDGQVALAIFAVKALDAAGGGKAAKVAAEKLASAYGAGSPRVDPAARPRPPAPPAKRAKAEAAAAAPAGVDAAVKLAKPAIAAAASRAEQTAAKPGKLPAVPLLGALDPTSLGELVGVMRPAVHDAGDVVVDTGQEAEALYLVARGVLKVSRGQHELGRLRPGAFFGEIALLGGTRRTARVACEEPSWLLEVPRPALEAAAAKAPRLADTMASYARHRLLNNVMRTSEVFVRLEPEERDALIGRFEPRVLEAGTYVLREGEEGSRLHVVVSGDLEVRRGGLAVAHLTAGDVFGEMSLLGRKPATADVVASSPTVTLGLDRARFDDVAIRHPELLAEVYKILVAREAQNRAAAGGEVDVEEIVL